MKEISTLSSGTEAKPLTKEDLENTIQKLRDMMPIVPPLIDKILHNCSESQLESVFGETKTEAAHTMVSLYGMPVLETQLVPDGEVWAVDRNGKLIKRFSFTPPSSLPNT